MKLLSIECSAAPASAAIIEDGNVKASAFVNTRLTHSETLLPLVEAVLASSKTQLADINAFAVAAGPGSFTGIRIGISALKGLAEAGQLPCYSVSTLRAMAENVSGPDCIICAVMDARCGQFYHALFRYENNLRSRMTPDRALMSEELIAELKQLCDQTQLPAVAVGDGAALFSDLCLKAGIPITLIRERDRYQNAVGVGLAAWADREKISPIDSKDLQPIYLRLPQAERELKRKQEEEK